MRLTLFLSNLSHNEYSSGASVCFLIQYTILTIYFIFIAAHHIFRNLVHIYIFDENLLVDLLWTICVPAVREFLTRFDDAWLQIWVWILKHLLGSSTRLSPAGKIALISFLPLFRHPLFTLGWQQCDICYSREKLHLLIPLSPRGINFFFRGMLQLAPWSEAGEGASSRPVERKIESVGVISYLNKQQLLEKWKRKKRKYYFSAGYWATSISGLRGQDHHLFLVLIRQTCPYPYCIWTKTKSQ